MAGLKQEATIVSNKKSYPFVIENKICIPLRRDTDIVLACQKGRTLAAQKELSDNDQVVVVIAISEIARNILHYAGQGQIILTPIQENGRQGIAIMAQDNGPGITDIEQVLQDGYSTGGGLGLGLSGAKRLMDEFEIISEVGRGTTITMKKWR